VSRVLAFGSEGKRGLICREQLSKVAGSRSAVMRFLGQLEGLRMAELEGGRIFDLVGLALEYAATDRVAFGRRCIIHSRRFASKHLSAVARDIMRPWPRDQRGASEGPVRR